MILVQFHFKMSKQREGLYSCERRKKELLVSYNTTGPRYKTGPKQIHFPPRFLKDIVVYFLLFENQKFCFVLNLSPAEDFSAFPAACVPET